ncbi:hypothetical protein SEUCBS139899_001998 [Sporothrix eucalyptigena]|uniref:Adenylyltransferase and sulfurtransferase uba4 n=1 Tax=Sporothrix eucalyptigena TaxID=1812306 RepID=A0ABP0CDM7_9PEZI
MSADLRRRIVAAEAELQSLREQLALAEEAEAADRSMQPDSSWKWPLAASDYDRYARQLILPSVGVQGQLALKKASVVLIGAGGLGCPAALYLAGAGVGHLTVVDGDTVETSNLHRQIGHTTARTGAYKVDSLVEACRERNPEVKYTAVREHVTVDNIGPLLANATLALDCTDHAAVRYLISDACVLAGVPLVSAAALRTDGQLSVLNWPVGRGPCYRCVFPRPPPAASQMSCAEGGVLGPVVGVMGVLQALEAIRVLTQPPPEPLQPTLLLFSASGGPSFRTVRLRGRRSDCFACSDDSVLKKGDGLDGGWPDYVQFCGGSTAVTQHVLAPEERVSVEMYKKLQEEDTPRKHWLLDVREKEFYNMGSIAGAVNVPFSQTRAGSSPEGLPSWLPSGLAEDTAPIYLVCRVGNDSQVVARQLKTLGLDREGTRFVGDVEGGLLAWKQRVDETMPFV